MNANVTGQSASVGNGQAMGTSIIQTLNNLSGDKQLVQIDTGVKAAQTRNPDGASGET